MKVKFGANRSLQRFSFGKRLTPSGVTRLPPQLSLSSIVLRPLHAEIFSSSPDTSPPPMTRAGQAPRTGGRLAALLVLKMVMVGKGTRTLLDVGGVGNFGLGNPLPPQAGWFEVDHLVTKTVMMATPPPPQAGLRELHTPPPTHISRSDPSDWLHYNVCALSEFVL